MEEAEGALAEPSSGGLTLDYFAPSPALQPHVTTLFCLSSDAPAMRDAIPAAVGYLMVFLQGSATVAFADGRTADFAPVSLLTPSSAAAEVTTAGPVRIVGAALSPLGWAALTGLHAARHGDRLYRASDYLEGTARLPTDGPVADAVEAVEAVARYVTARLRPVNPRHAALMKQVGEWLSASLDPPLADLAVRSGYSDRQLQRLVERYFGVGPMQLARKYRALRVAALLQAPDTSEARIAELLNLFYDQSHLIREMRHFLGRTPSRLGSSDSPLLGAATGLRNYHEVRPNIARMPGD